jgi:2-C-methyl-D-erythritol 4-phosphate cytidylyltransferase/2-C-methyl-D-erythritol 2,4-cyclodiphosphate synthase
VTGISDQADAIVVAAGASRRMGGIDKVLAPVAGRPLLAWTLDALAAAQGVERIVVATAGDRVRDVAGAAWLPASVVAVVAGGSRRQESVAAGFAALEGPDDRVVLVHDGARPFVPASLVVAIIDAANRHGAAIPVLPVAETVKRIDGQIVAETVDRRDLATAQTPQAARAGLLRAAWAANPADGPITFTDEAALLEAARIPVHAIPGDPMNLKVTVPFDLERAAMILGPDQRGIAPSTRVGFGGDSHPFGPGDPLALGGVTIAGAPRLHGHSDGDVALHAVADALLGAAGQGDLGRLFPAGPSTPRGIASSELLAAVVARIGAAGFVPLSVDVTIVGARPRLAGHLDRMRDTIAELLGLSAGSVDVKASTGNLAGMEGAGRGISAQAIAVVGPVPAATAIGGSR